jgi:hypothetical protein
MTAVGELIVSSPTEPWATIGLRVVDGRSWIGGVCVRFVDDRDGEPQRLIGWTLVGSPSMPDHIDGLATTHVDQIEAQAWQHPLGATGIDHVVVMTSSIERTCGEIERVTGEPLKRVREAGPVRQGFHRLGPVIVEVVESDRAPEAVAQLWGFVMVVDDLFETASALGPDVLSPPRQAVQPGRFIASFRASAGLGPPIALMSPHVR